MSQITICNKFALLFKGKNNKINNERVAVEVKLDGVWVRFGFISIGEQALNLVFCEIAGSDMAAPIKL